MARIPAELDGASTRLQALIVGIADGEFFPHATAKTLQARARGTRRLIEALEYGLALELLTDIVTIADDAGADSEASSGAKLAAKRLAERANQLGGSLRRAALRDGVA